jgi:hypothetical protein
MAVNIQLPAAVESELRSQFENLDEVAREAMLVELYRQDNLSHHQLGQALGLDRFETDGLLKRHKVTEDLPTLEEYDSALRRLGMPKT